MAAHSSVLAWRIPGMTEPGGLPSMGSHRIRHDWSDLAAAAAVPNDVEHFFMCFCFIWISSLEKCIFIWLVLFLIGLSVFLLLHSKSSLCILDTWPLLRIWLANVFSHRMGCVHFLDGVPWNTKVVNFDKVQFIFCFVAYAFGVISKNFV